jgi:hypothetical protein
LPNNRSRLVDGGCALSDQVYNFKHLIKMETKAPTLPELLKDKELSTKTAAINSLLNEQPPSDWLKTHPTASGVKYLPIERVEWLLSRIYGQWRVEIKETKIIANSMMTIVRLHYFDPYISGQWQWQDGVGAAPLQTDKGAGAIEFDKIKNDAVMKAAPASESFAIKDAAEKLGKIFGKDINRKSYMDYNFMAAPSIKDEPTPEIYEQIKAATTADELGAIYKANQKYHGSQEFIKALGARKQELKNGL